uniref:Uncharacterized protein n=1 Tax=Candidatus Kentrum sp. TUN TaxID=2126343 RepID=A0A451A4A5_9GAMM|nr:MAG: hypothetical protein BECKTUN1418D_GA0071000_11377 [Candidatus Kentron sp. TUN]
MALLLGKIVYRDLKMARKSERIGSLNIVSIINEFPAEMF